MSQDRRAVVLGGVAWNEMVYLDHFPRPEPATVFASHSHQTVGSSGAGKALNFARLGWSVTLWAALGDDDDGQRIRDRMRMEQIRFLAAVDPAGTTHHVNLMAGDGERISIFARYGTAALPVDHRAVLASTDFESADVVTVSIFEHCRGFLPLLVDAGTPLWIDIHDYDGVNPYHDDFIEAADRLVMSTVAFPDWRRFAEQRLEAGSELVACTHGSDGASLLTAAGWHDLPAQEAVIIDTNGAGDAFTAALAQAWCEGHRPEEALSRAVDWAARAVASPELAPLA